MRLFLAIPVHETICANLSSATERLAQSGADVRWVESGNFHLTVRFVGDVGEDIADEVRAACEVAASETEPFAMSVRGVRTFPKGKPTIKTIFANMDEGAEEWRALVQQVEPALANLGVPRENGLAVHITLGRARSDTEISALRVAVARESETDFGAQIADRLELVQSFLDARGALYQTIGTWPFTKCNQSIAQ